MEPYGRPVDVFSFGMTLPKTDPTHASLNFFLFGGLGCAQMFSVGEKEIWWFPPTPRKLVQAAAAVESGG